MLDCAKEGYITSDGYVDEIVRLSDIMERDLSAIAGQEALGELSAIEATRLREYITRYKTIHDRA